MRAYNITKAASEYLLSLPPKQCKQVLSKLLSLANNPMQNDSAKLKGYQDL